MRALEQRPGLAPVAFAHRAHWSGGTVAQSLVVPLITLAALVAYAAIYTHYLDPRLFPVVRSDGAGYYAYLPAYLLHHDPTMRSFVSHDLHGLEPFEAGLTLVPATGNYLDKYPIGESVLMMPFFAFGHAVALVAGQRADGYSPAEQAAAGLSGLFYMVAGLWVLRAVLSRYFSPWVVAATLVTLVFGTNLFHYATFDSIFSHAYSFFLVSSLIALVHRWYERPQSWRVAAALGMVAGLIVLVRQVNSVFILLVPLFGLGSIALTAARVRLWRRHLPRLGLMAACAAAVIAPQLWVWHEATGQWLVYSYGAERFNFGSPHLPGALLSFDPHGLLPWSPIVALALPGFAVMRRYAPRMLVPAAVILVLDTYLIASWSNWLYGGGYGHRGFIEALPLLAFGLASLYAAARPLWARIPVGAVATLLCAAATTQMLHYWRLQIPFGGASWPQYLHILRQPVF